MTSIAVWITHHGTIGTGLAGHSQHGPLAWTARQMFSQRGHYLFPKVPVSRLKGLAQRLDDSVPVCGAATAGSGVSEQADPMKDRSRCKVEQTIQSNRHVFDQPH